MEGAPSRRQCAPRQKEVSPRSCSCLSGYLSVVSLRVFLGLSREYSSQRQVAAEQLNTATVQLQQTTSGARVPLKERLQRLKVRRLYIYA